MKNAIAVFVGLCLLAACGAAVTTPPGATTPGTPTPSTPTPDPMPNATWSNPAAWPSGKVPLAGEAVVIPAGKVMMLDVSPPALKSVYIAGTLKFAQVDLELTAGYIMVHDGSLQIGSAQIPFTKQATITLTGAETGADPLGMGEKFIGVMGTGTLDLHGAPVTSWTRLTQTADIGAKSLVLENASGWKEGDALAIASTDYDTRQAEEVTITKLEGNTATLKSALKYMHYGRAQPFAGKTLESRAEVALLRRNIVIQGEATSSATGFGGHLMVMDTAKARIENVELTRMGQLKKLKRYPIHFHMQGDNGDGSYVKNAVLHHNFNRCITVHGTGKLLLESNVGYDTVGHCYFMEDGSEAGNTLKSNLGFMTRCTLEKDQYGNQKGCYLLSSADTLLPTDTQPATYWITNPANTMVGNVAAGSDTFGFWFALPERPTGPSATDLRFKDWQLRHTPLTAFKGNIAHSNGNTGLNVDGGPNKDLKSETTHYSARANPMDEKSAIVPVVFEDFTAYRNRNRGVWLRGSLHTVRGAVLADNAIGATFASNDTQIEDSVVIGESANKGTPGQYEKAGLDGRSLPQAYNDEVAKFPIRGFEFYDGKVGAARVTFVNFQSNASRPASALSYLRFTDFNTDPRNAADKLSFENANPVYLALEKAEPTAPNSSGMDGYRSAVFIDTDGSVTGSSGRSVVVNNPFLLNANCGAPKAEWGNAAVCNNPYGAFNFQNVDSNLVEISPVAITRLEDAKPQHKMWGTPNDKAFKDSFSTRLIVGKSYALALSGAMPNHSRLQLYNRSPNDAIQLSLPWSAADPFVYRDYYIANPDQYGPRGRVLKAANRAEFEAATGDKFFVEAGVLYLKLQVKLDPKYPRDDAVLDVCKTDLCK